MKPRNGVFARFEGRDYRSVWPPRDGVVELVHDDPEPPDERFGEYAAGFERVGKWEFRARVPVSALQDHRETHVDLLSEEERLP